MNSHFRGNKPGKKEKTGKKQMVGDGHQVGITYRDYPFHLGQKKRKDEERNIKLIPNSRGQSTDTVNPKYELWRRKDWAVMDLTCKEFGVKGAHLSPSWAQKKGKVPSSKTKPYSLLQWYAGMGKTGHQTHKGEEGPQLGGVGDVRGKSVVSGDQRPKRRKSVRTLKKGQKWGDARRPRVWGRGNPVAVVAVKGKGTNVLKTQPKPQKKRKKNKKKKNKRGKKN